MKNPRLNKNRLSGSRRALSPIFSTLILASIVIIFGAVAYYYASNATTTATNNYVSTTQTNQAALSERIGFENVDYTRSPSTLKIYIINCGTANDVKAEGIFLKDATEHLIGYFTASTLFNMGGGPLTDNSLNVGDEAYFTVSLGATSLSSGSIYTIQVVTQRGNNYANQYIPPSPTVTISPPEATLDVGQSQQFTATAYGGSGIYTTYKWYVGTTEVQSGSSPSYTYTATQTGSYQVSVTVTDDSGGISSQATASVTVNSAPTVTITPTTATMSVGQSQTFIAAASGGTGLLHYQWYVAGAPKTGATSPAFTFTASVSDVSPVNIYVVVTDSSTPPAQGISNTAIVTISSGP